MVRRFRADRDVPLETVERLVRLAQRAPSAGHTQGWDVLALTDAADRERFWAVTRDRTATEPDQRSRWLQGVSAAPVLLVMLADPTAYLDRYAEPDKGWTDRSLDRWPIPYWDTDTAMAAMVLLLGAVDAGLGALFFGVPGARHDAAAKVGAASTDLTRHEDVPRAVHRDVRRGVEERGGDALGPARRSGGIELGHESIIKQIAVRGASCGLDLPR